MFWIIFLVLVYLTLIIFYREAKPLVRVGFILLLVLITPLFSGRAGFPGFDPEGIGTFLADVISYYMEILKSFAQASGGA
ncbi:hypothetical protein KGY79_05135 [Candidatus Bipolaricaulota bacterium]|nr:hypothetical protein [Candidatus Bipolaricaulota bacterium]